MRDGVAELGRGNERGELRSDAVKALPTMVDNSCIIEGNVKFRDGKKVSRGHVTSCRVASRRVASRRRRREFVFRDTRVLVVATPLFSARYNSLPLLVFRVRDVTSRENANSRVRRATSAFTSHRVRDCLPSHPPPQGFLSLSLSLTLCINYGCTERSSFARYSSTSHLSTSLLVRDKNYVTITL